MPLESSLINYIKKTKCQELDLSNRGLDENDMDQLEEAMRENPHITSLDLSRNNIGPKSIMALCSLLNTVKKLNLENNMLDDGSIEKLLTHNKNSKLEWLNVSNNEPTDKAANLLYQHLSSPTSPLKYVSAEKNYIGKDLISKINIINDSYQGSTAGPLKENKEMGPNKKGLAKNKGNCTIL